MKAHRARTVAGGGGYDQDRKRFRDDENHGNSGGGSGRGGDLEANAKRSKLATEKLTSDRVRDAIVTLWREPNRSQLGISTPT